MGEALNLQGNHLTQEGADLFQSVMNEMKALQLVDLRDNRGQAPGIETPVTSFPKRPFLTKNQSASDDVLLTYKPSRYRTNFLAQPKFGYQKPQITKTTYHSITPRAAMAATLKLPLRPKSAPGRTQKLVSEDQRVHRSTNGISSTNSLPTPMTAQESIQKSISKKQRALKSMQSCTSKNKMKTYLNQTHETKTTPERNESESSNKQPEVDACTETCDLKTSLRPKPIAPSEQHANRVEDATLTSVSYPLQAFSTNLDKRKSEASTLEGSTHLPQTTHKKMSKKRSRLSCCPPRQAPYRKMTSLVRLLDSRSAQAIVSEHQRRRRIRARMLNQFDNPPPQAKKTKSRASSIQGPQPHQGIHDAKHFMKPEPTSNKEKEETEWNSFITEMTATLLNLKGTTFVIPHCRTTTDLPESERCIPTTTDILHLCSSLTRPMLSPGIYSACKDGTWELEIACQVTLASIMPLKVGPAPTATIKEQLPSKYYLRMENSSNYAE